MRSRLALVFAALLAAPASLTAQMVTARVPGIGPLHGRVVLDDGSPPPKGFTIMSTCGNLASWRDGTFTFTREATQGRSGRYVSQAPQRCDLVISRRGFRTYHGILPDQDTIVVLRRIGSEETVLASVGWKELECSARQGAAYGEGEAAMGLRQWAAAEKRLRSAVEACPAHARAWDELGLSLEMQGRSEEARAAYQKSAEADAQLALPLVHLAGVALAAGRNTEALELSERALKLKPVSLPRAWFYHCVASFEAGHFDAAEKSARRTIEEDRQHRFPRAEYLLGEVLARKGKADEAAIHLRAFLRLAPDDPDAGRARQLAAEMEKSATP
jgi:Flp pilus assembly protein TadD